MLDIGWSELAVIALIALLVIGPKDLPKALYTVGKWTRAARKVTREFQKHVDDMMREADLEDVRKNLKQAQAINVKKQIRDTIDPKGEIKDALDDPTVNSDTIARPGKSAGTAGSAAKVKPPQSGLTTEAEQAPKRPETNEAPNASKPTPAPAPAEATPAEEKTS